jgi:VanZ family protein
MASSSLLFRASVPQISDSGSAWIKAPWRIWLPVLACVTIFAVESTSYFGADSTSVPLQRIAEAVFGYDVGVHWKLIHYLIRKIGHFMGYGLFSVVCFRAFWMVLQRPASRLQRQLRAYGLAVLTALLVASADELHQSFLPNRTGQFSDVLLDGCGAATAGLVFFLALRTAEGRRRTRAHAVCRLEPAACCGSPVAAEKESLYVE